MSTNLRLEDLASVATMAGNDLLLTTDVSESPFESKKITWGNMLSQIGVLPFAFSAGNKEISLHDEIIGYDLLNLRMTDTNFYQIASITCPITTATVTTTSPHGMPYGTYGFQVVITGASPVQYNGLQFITPTGPNTFRFELSGSLPDADPPGEYYFLPVCLITGPLGDDVPDNVYPNLVLKASGGSLFLNSAPQAPNFALFVMYVNSQATLKIWSNVQA